MNKLLSYLILVLTLMACKSDSKKSTRVDELPYYTEATFKAKWFEKGELIPENFHQIPSFSLINQSGDTITEKDVEGKIYVTDFFFTSCPGICPRMTNNMAIIQQEFMGNEKVLLLSHSVTPEYDSVSVLKNYAQTKGVISGKWHLLTGSRDQIYNLGRNSYFVEEDLGLAKDTGDFIHTENFVLIDG
ncbi:MAG: SCO family protein [Bacteroidota bacterium]